MRVVVLGATGNVGSAVMHRLVDDPDVDQIVAIARRPPGKEWPKTRFAAADVGSDDLTPHFRGADVVVHLAWIFQPTHRPGVTWTANVGGTIRVLEAAVRAGVSSLVYASSVGCYSPGQGPVDESWPTHAVPAAAYGREKSYVERLLDVFEAEHPSVRVVRLRTAFIFQRASSTQQRRLFAGPFVPSILLRVGRIPLVPYPSGLTFQALHASDAAAAYHLAIKSEARGPFNVAAEPTLDEHRVAAVLGGRPVPVPTRLVRAALTAGWTAHLVPADPALFELAVSLPLMNTDLVRGELGWQPQVSATDALAEVVAGMSRGAGGRTEPLAPDSPVRRARELLSGVGQRP